MSLRSKLRPIWLTSFAISLVIGLPVSMAVSERGAAASDLSSPESNGSEDARQLYGSVCSSCHGSTLDGASRGPPLKGPGFLSHWNGKSAYELYMFIALKMPSNDPGSVDEQEGVDLVVELLKANGMAVDLKQPHSSEDLKTIKISK